MLAALHLWEGTGEGAGEHCSSNVDMSGMLGFDARRLPLWTQSVQQVRAVPRPAMAVGNVFPAQRRRCSTQTAVPLYERCVATRAPRSSKAAPWAGHPAPMFRDLTDRVLMQWCHGARHRGRAVISHALSQWSMLIRAGHAVGRQGRRRLVRRRRRYAFLSCTSAQASRGSTRKALAVHAIVQRHRMRQGAGKDATHCGRASQGSPSTCGNASRGGQDCRCWTSSSERCAMRRGWPAAGRQNPVQALMALMAQARAQGAQ
jgi:hypothetical protein